jgi:NAD(P)H dehydrogenase (quinone)
MTRILILIFIALHGFVDLSRGEVNVLVVYFSAAGHTRAMAEAVAAGAESLPGVRVKLASVAEATIDDLLEADAIIVGSPVYNANVAPAVQEFINGWPFVGEADPLRRNGAPLRDKIGAAFVSAGGMSAGEELTQLNILHSMLIFGMIVVGGPEWTQAFGAAAVVEEPPFDAASQTELVAPAFLKKAEALGKRVAELAIKLKCR